MNDSRELVPIKDKTAERSVINMVPSVMATAIACIPDEFFEKTTDELAAIFRKGRNGYTKDTEIEEKLRISFWREYDRAMTNGRRMELSRICSGVCHVNAMRNIVNNSARLAYILTPPDDFILTMEELMKLGHEQLRDILLRPHVKDDGTLDARAADVKLKIVESVTLRAKGSVASRIETKNLNVNVEADSQKAASAVASLQTPEEVHAKLEQLRALAGVSPATETIDVTPEEG